LPSLPLEALPGEPRQIAMAAASEPTSAPEDSRSRTAAALQGEPETTAADAVAALPSKPERQADMPAAEPAAAVPAHTRHGLVAAIKPAKPADPLAKDHERVERLNELSLAAARRGVEWRPKGQPGKS
jgi:hypothetical protein